MIRRTTNQIASRANDMARKGIDAVNSSFNALTIRGKKLSVVIFSVMISGIGVTLIMQALGNQENDRGLSLESMRIPIDIYMKNQANTISENQLIPVGKLKGEIDGDFEAFYLAVDHEGKTYINPWPGVSQDAYNKSNGWREISREELERYQKHLHFLPAKTKGLKP